MPLSNGWRRGSGSRQAAFADYAGRPQTMTDHARMLAATSGCGRLSNADLPLNDRGRGAIRLEHR